MRKVGWAATAFILICVQGIGQLGSARAEGRSHSKKSAAVSVPTSLWNHNGSVVSLVTSGGKQKLFYDAPRIGLRDAGVKPGTLLFEGQRTGQNFEGTAYQFYRSCKPHGFSVTGSVSDDRRQITLKGKAPQLDLNCNVTGSRDDTLIFTASQVAPGEPPKSAPIAAATGATAPAHATNFPSEANKIEASKPTIANTIVSSAPPVSARTVEAPAAESKGAKVANTNTASAAVPVTAAVTPSEPPKDNPKDKPVAANPPPESKPAPSAEPAKSEAAKSESAKDEKPPAAAQIAASTPAAANTVAPPGGLAKEIQKSNQSVSTSASAASASKPEVSNTASVQTQTGQAPPKSEPPKSAQVAAIPEATGSTAKTDDAGKPKSAAAAVVVAVPNNVPDKSKSDPPKSDTSKSEPSKSDVAKLNGNKTAASLEIRAAPASASEKMMEIVLKNGRILRIGRDVEPDTLARIISQLER